MINLIPPKGHKAAKYEYYLRVAATFCFLFSGVFILLVVAMIPTYVLVGAQIDAFETEKQQLVESSTALTSADAEVKLTKEILAQFKRLPERPESSAIISEILSVAPAQISFTSFIISAHEKTVDSVQLRGQAPTREALADLKRDLEGSDMFEKAEVPIADLARDVDVPFAITVTLSKQK